MKGGALSEEEGQGGIGGIQMCLGPDAEAVWCVFDRPDVRMNCSCCDEIDAAWQ